MYLYAVGSVTQRMRTKQPSEGRGGPKVIPGVIPVWVRCGSGEGTVIYTEREILLPVILTEGHKDHEALRSLRYLL